MTAHRQVAKLLEQAKDMADDIRALPWSDLSEDEAHLVFPLGIGLLKSMQAAADIVRRGKHNA